MASRRRPPTGAVVEGAAEGSKASHSLDPSIVFGTDFPFRTAGDHVKGLKDCGVFSSKDLAAIDRDNALKFLPRFRV